MMQFLLSQRCCCIKNCSTQKMFSFFQFSRFCFFWLWENCETFVLSIIRFNSLLPDDELENFLPASFSSLALMFTFQLVRQAGRQRDVWGNWLYFDGVSNNNAWQAVFFMCFIPTLHMYSEFLTKKKWAKIKVKENKKKTKEREKFQIFFRQWS